MLVRLRPVGLAAARRPLAEHVLRRGQLRSEVGVAAPGDYIVQ